MTASLEDMSDDEILRRAEGIKRRRHLEEARDRALAEEMFRLDFGGPRGIKVDPAVARPIISAHFDRLLGDLAED